MHGTGLQPWVSLNTNFRIYNNLWLKFLRSNTQRLDFSVSVSFTDVTAPASPLFADIPVLQAKFPHDFFYPFVSSAAAAGRAMLLVKFCPFVTFTLSFLVPLLRL